MGHRGLLIGELAARGGVSRKAIRLYEALAVLTFVTQARRLGFSLAEIQEIVAIRRTGQLPCAHVQVKLRQKAADLDRLLGELAALRRSLHAALGGRRSHLRRQAAICPHIEGKGGEGP